MSSSSTSLTLSLARGVGTPIGSTEEITNAFLAEFSGKEEGIWVIGATNRREVVDDAILSRFGMELELMPPDEKCRIAILNQELMQAGYKGTFPANASNLMQVMSGCDIAMLAQRLAGKGGAGR